MRRIIIVSSVVAATAVAVPATAQAPTQIKSKHIADGRSIAPTSTKGRSPRPS